MFSRIFWAKISTSTLWNFKKFTLKFFSPKIMWNQHFFKLLNSRFDKIFFSLFLFFHNVEISEFFCYLDHTWNQSWRIWSLNILGKFHDFSITQILRENNFGDSWSAKSAILTLLEALKALNLDFHVFLHFLKADFYQIDKIQSL